MLPAERSQSDWSLLLNLLIAKVHEWIRQEIVDDDPWDQDTLFPNLQESTLKQPRL